jgi:hypothetical protein
LIILCPFCLTLCQTALRRAKKVDNPVDRQLVRIEDIPGQTAKQLRNGVACDCYICGRFWAYTSEEYRQGVESGCLYPPANLWNRVNTFSMHVTTLVNNTRKRLENPSITIMMYHSNVPYLPYNSPGFHPSRPKFDYQEFKTLLPSGLLRP